MTANWSHIGLMLTGMRVICLIQHYTFNITKVEITKTMIKQGIIFCPLCESKQRQKIDQLVAIWNLI